jgi:hypothetical protein
MFPKTKKKKKNKNKKKKKKKKKEREPSTLCMPNFCPENVSKFDKNISLRTVHKICP